ncbi:MULTISPECIES: hypothetical protein [Pseudomonas]|jgi:hypothetical protein|uniref:Type 1 fimbrial protein n=2 Tax=Pseudomonas fluorescens group TaxID=136843 RepID=A0A7Z1GTV3_9PSED|nr:MULTISPECIES: hypothetical protein [Pseudomonas]HAA38501.1 hypothetical protein [Pseudomonas sp.]KAA8554627.1 hypothetical protein FX984_01240 [Pseudomonas marginalis]NMZ95318.1 type 1 fimbrial protein [Pseudomonas marginalis]PFG71023.1 hypothetical protein DM05_1367 [Pseudomonas poae]RDS87929.1 type 1 fimbrial protein [Pseudomonas fluorescens]
MRINGFSAATCLLCLWASTCGAAQPAGQGTIRFTGSIVEPLCATNAHSGARMDVTGCPSASRGNRFDVRSMAPVASVNGASLRLVADSGSGRYYDQTYLLVDSLGKPIQSGNYVVTMTAP